MLACSYSKTIFLSKGFIASSELISFFFPQILNKFPVIQHVLFGSIFTLKKAASMKPPNLFLPAKGIGGILPPGRPLGSFGSPNRPVAVVSPSVVQAEPPADETSTNS